MPRGEISPSSLSRTLTSPTRPTIVVVGPSSTLTVPGVIVSQIVTALVRLNPVTQVDVDLGTNYDAGNHRAASLAAAHDEARGTSPIRHRAPTNARLRDRAFRQWIAPDVGAAVAFVWPGIDSGWIRPFIAAAREARVPAIVVCASVPRAKQGRLAAMAGMIADADLILVGDETDAAALASADHSVTMNIETHRALTLRGSDDEGADHVLTAFLPRDGHEALTTLLEAFGAIPEAWVDRCLLQIVIRFSGPEIPALVASSDHAKSVRLISHDISSPALERLCNNSSALIVADPAFDSRAFSVAVGCGVPIVVLSSTPLPDVGHGYVGALLADLSRPVSVHVALTHALRLAELQFPEPDAWNSLAKRLLAELTVEVEGSATSPTSRRLPPRHA